MAQQRGRQYDDDLTVGAEEYAESFSTQYVDLFEPLGEEDAPIAKLKTIVLSIDWEITDDILDQLNDELQDLKDVWAGNKINLVYLQALEKIGKYIFAEKANAHPNAIKLLLTFYYDLEKIVSSAAMTEAEKKQLLLQDVKKFDQFKLQIAPPAKVEMPAGDSPVSSFTPPPAPAAKRTESQKNVLTNLKAIVLGIDWEISDKDLLRLSEEVTKLEKVFSESRAKLIFLQGIGALGNYIKSAKSSAHINAFKLLHSFFEGLERAYHEVLSPEQEKELLLAEVKKFNALKAEIAAVASEVVVSTEEDSSAIIGMEEEEEEDEEEGHGFVTPAFSDVPADVHGFSEDAEAVQGDIDRTVASFLGEVDEELSPAISPEAVGEDAEVGSRLASLFGEDEGGHDILEEVSPLAGVEVETEADDDSGEKSLPLQGGELAPALAGTSCQSQFVESFSQDEGSEAALAESFDTASIPGVDVETEADDDSDEAALPQYEGGVAPALAFAEEEKEFCEQPFIEDSEDVELDLEERLHSFFGAEIEEAMPSNGLGEIDQVEASPAVLPDSVDLESSFEESLITELDKEQEEELASTDFFAMLDADGGKEESGAPALDLEAAHDAAREAEERSVESELILPDEFMEIVATETPAEAVFEAVSGMDESADTLAFTEAVEDLGEAAEEVSALSVKDVVFEPVGDDVEIDPLPVISLVREDLSVMRESVAMILDRQYDSGFSALFVEARRLQESFHSWLVGRLLVHLLVLVSQNIQIQKENADANAYDLLSLLMESLEQICSLNNRTESEQLLYEMTEKVLSWQQGLLVRPVS